jgi:hypothetical protein
MKLLYRTSYPKKTLEFASFDFNLSFQYMFYLDRGNQLKKESNQWRAMINKRYHANLPVVPILVLKFSTLAYGQIYR